MNKLLLVSALALAGCASHTNKIPAAYVSPMQYQEYSCKQVAAEMTRVSTRAQQVAYEVDKNATGDSTAMGVGLILFWPALFFIDGDTPQAQEYASLKGQFNALEEAAVQKDCGITVQENPFQKLESARAQKQPNVSDHNDR